MKIFMKIFDHFEKLGASKGQLRVIRVNQGPVWDHLKFPHYYIKTTSRSFHEYFQIISSLLQDCTKTSLRLTKDYYKTASRLI